jgi:hypothetical protein
MSLAAVTVVLSISEPSRYASQFEVQWIEIPGASEAQADTDSLSGSST